MQTSLLCLNIIYIMHAHSQKLEFRMMWPLYLMHTLSRDINLNSQVNQAGFPITFEQATHHFTL